MVRAYLVGGLTTHLSGSPARGSDQCWIVRIEGSDVQVCLSGSGPFLELEGTDTSPILPQLSLRDYIRWYSLYVFVAEPNCRDKFSYGNAYADFALQSRVLVQGPNLQVCLDLARQIEDKTAKATNLPMKSAVAVATRRKRRPLNPTPHVRRRFRPVYQCHGCGNGRHYRLREGGK